MSALVDVRGKTIPTADAVCPRCLKPCPVGDARARVSSSGFGEPHDCCRRCGHDFDEDTLTGEAAHGR